MSDNPETVAAPINLLAPEWYINRELSALEFQRRVLDEAKDPTTPLLDRVKFVAIVGSNLDEFFMVRVAGLKKQVDAGVQDVPPDGLTPARQLTAIRKVALEIMRQAHEYWSKEIIPALKNAGIHILSYHQLTEKQCSEAEAYYNQNVFPVLTPLAVDPGHPFPHISNLSLNLAVMVRDRQGKERFARLKVPGTLPRLVPLKRSGGAKRKDGTTFQEYHFVWLDQIIAANLPSLFPGMEIIESHAFRVTRDADLEIQELEADDLLESMENSVRQRRFGSVVRLTINPSMPNRIRQILVEKLAITPADVYPVDGSLGLSTLFSLSQMDRPDLREPIYKPNVPTALHCVEPNGNIFETIQCGNILLHHPYDSFQPVIDFLQSAATDPDVLAIKQTLYRVGKNPPVVNALLQATENRKQVAVLVELKARFDEESNIGWARKLESQGVHVVYGLLGLKTHSKIVLVVRKEGEGIRRYLHLSTGNYNAITANLYEDIGMFTCDDEIGADATDLFNYLTGYSSNHNFRKLLVAPINLRQRLETLIRREIELQKQGEPGHLIFKVNSLVDQSMIRLLYEASQAGVKIDLITRYTCCLRPGVPGVSENIRVISVLGRFLEHSRIYYFRNAGREEIYLGSADLMPRNLDRRVEVLFPVQQPALIRTLRDEILEIYLKDNVKARLMKPDGKYEHVKPEKGEPLINSQEWFMRKRNG